MEIAHHIVGRYFVVFVYKMNYIKCVCNQSYIIAAFNIINAGNNINLQVVTKNTVCKVCS